MPTLGALIEQVRLAARDHPPYDTVSGSYTNSTTAVTFADGTALPVNTLFDWYDQTFEASLVTAKSSATAGTMVRGVRGTTATSHSAGAVVLPKPRFLLTQYRDAINNALRAIGVQFRRRQWQTSVSFTDSARLLSVPTTATGVFAVMERMGTDAAMLPVSFTFLPSVPTSVVTNGKAVQLEADNPGTGTAYIGYETAWTELSAWTDSTDAEFPADAVDVIVEGAIRYLENPDIFARLAFTKPHVEGTGPRSGESQLIAAVRMQMGTFFARRQELASRQPPNFTWIKG